MLATSSEAGILGGVLPVVGGEQGDAREDNDDEEVSEKYFLLFFTDR